MAKIVLQELYPEIGTMVDAIEASENHYLTINSTSFVIENTHANPKAPGPTRKMLLTWSRRDKSALEERYIDLVENASRELKPENLTRSEKQMVTSYYKCLFDRYRKAYGEHGIDVGAFKQYEERCKQLQNKYALVEKLKGAHAYPVVDIDGVKLALNIQCDEMYSKPIVEMGKALSDVEVEVVEFHSYDKMDNRTKRRLRHDYAEKSVVGPNYAELAENRRKEILGDLKTALETAEKVFAENVALPKKIIVTDMHRKIYDSAAARALRKTEKEFQSNFIDNRYSRLDIVQDNLWEVYLFNGIEVDDPSFVLTPETTERMAKVTKVWTKAMLWQASVLPSFRRIEHDKFPRVYTVNDLQEIVDSLKNSVTKM